MRIYCFTIYGNEKVRLDALKFLTEMDIGKARQAVDANMNDGKLEVTVEVIE